MMENKKEIIEKETTEFDLINECLYAKDIPRSILIEMINSGNKKLKSWAWKTIKHDLELH